MSTLLVRIIEGHNLINLNNIKKTLTLLNAYTGGIELECSRDTYRPINVIVSSPYPCRINFTSGASYGYSYASFIGYLLMVNDAVPDGCIQIKLC